MLRSSLYILAGLCLCWLLVKGTSSCASARTPTSSRARPSSCCTRRSSARPELARIDAPRARMLLEDALELRDDVALRGRLAYTEALEEYQKGRAPRAQAALRARAQPGRAAWSSRCSPAISRSRRARGAGAAKFAAAALALDAHDARARLLAADAAADTGDAAARSRAARRVDRAKPGDRQLLQPPRPADEALGHTDAARADFERACELDPSLPQPYINLGRLLRDQGRAQGSRAGVRHGDRARLDRGTGLARPRAVAHRAGRSRGRRARRAARARAGAGRTGPAGRARRRRRLARPARQRDRALPRRAGARRPKTPSPGSSSATRSRASTSTPMHATHSSTRSRSSPSSLPRTTAWAPR